MWETRYLKHKNQIEYGVPNGSIFRPVLFTLYVNKVNKTTHLKMYFNMR